MTIDRCAEPFSFVAKASSLLAALLIIFGISWGNSLRAAPVTQLKVMSFNIWVQGGLSLSNCVATIQTTGADLVGLQECNATTAQTIANNLGFYVLPANDCSIVSRYPILTTYVIGNSRGVTVELAPGQRAHLFNCHLAPYPYGPYDLKNGQSQTFIINQEHSTRMPALNQLLTQMQLMIAGPEPCFLVGDFNAPSHLDYTSFPWPTSIACTNTGLADSYHQLHSANRKFPPPFAYNEPGITWTPKISEEPEGVFDRIDFVHYSIGDGTTPTASAELDERNSINPWPSDHRAVITTFTLTPPTPLAKASQPSPPHQATNVTLNPILSWLPRSNAYNHTIFFGASTSVVLLASTPAAYVSLTNLTPNATYYWRVDESTTNGLIGGDLWSFTTAAINANNYEWTFAQGNLAAAIGQGALTYVDGMTASLTSFGTSDGTTVPHMQGKPVTYLHAPGFSSASRGYHVSFNQSGANGGGAYINQYTMIFDLLLPGSLGWLPFFNTNPNNLNDADFYISPTGEIGIAAIGYSPVGTIAANTWYRIAFVAGLASGTVTYYVNGSPVYTGAADLDGRHSLYSSLNPGPDLLLFNEGDASGVYTHEVYLSSFAFADRMMSASEIVALGGPKARGIFINPPPIMAAAHLQGTNFVLSWAGGEAPYQVQRSMSLTNGGWQNFGGLTTGTNLVIPLTVSPSFFRVLGQ